MSLTRRLLVAAAPILSLAPSLALAAPAPAFSVKDADGKTRSLSEFKGRTVVLEWVNEGCPYVKKHYSGNMQALQRAAAADGVVWLSVVSSAPGEQGYFADGSAAKKWAATNKAAPSAILLDPEGKMGMAYGAKTTPHMYIIDKTGQLVYQGGIDDKPTNKVEDIKTAKNYVTAALADVKAGRKPAVAVSKPYGCSVKYKA